MITMVGYIALILSSEHSSLVSFLNCRPHCEHFLSSLLSRLHALHLGTKSALIRCSAGFGAFFRLSRETSSSVTSSLLLLSFPRFAKAASILANRAHIFGVLAVSSAWFDSVAGGGGCVLAGEDGGSFAGMTLLRASFPWLD